MIKQVNSILFTGCHSSNLSYQNNMIKYR